MPSIVSLAETTLAPRLASFSTALCSSPTNLPFIVYPRLAFFIFTEESLTLDIPSSNTRRKASACVINPSTLNSLLRYTGLYDLGTYAISDSEALVGVLKLPELSKKDIVTCESCILQVSGELALVVKFERDSGIVPLTGRPSKTFTKVALPFLYVGFRFCSLSLSTELSFRLSFVCIAVILSHSI